MKLNTLTKLMKWFSISLACAATSLVGVPTDIDYNGSLADETGALLDGEVQMEFAIGTEDASSVYWTQEASPVMVTQGVFSTVLSGVDSDILGNPDLYLHVWVGETAETLEALGVAPLNSVPYAVRAGAVNVEDIEGEIGGIIPEGAIDAEMLGTVLIDVPFIDADGDGVPDDPEAEGARRVSIQDILQSISDNSKLGFEQVSDERMEYHVLLAVDQPIASQRGWIEGSPASANRPIDVYDSHYKDPFPISQVYEYNGGLMPKIDILDVDTKEVITGEFGNPVPGIAFLWVEEDVEGTSPNVSTWGPFGGPPFTRFDGWDEGRMVVAGEPTEVGDFEVLVRATNAWGQDFVQVYNVQVREIEIDEQVFMEREDAGNPGVWTTDGIGGIDEGNDISALGGDPVRARFETDDDVLLTENIVVRWTYPDPDSLNPSDTLTVDIAGEDGKAFYVHSEAGDDMGSPPSMGAQLLDNNPFIVGGRSHIGAYDAQILLDWGQGVDIGSANLITVNEGFSWPDNATVLRYEAGADVSAPTAPGYVAPPSTPIPLFNHFVDNSTDILGTKSVTGQVYGLTPAGDQGAPIGNGEEDWHLRGVITGGDTSKGLVGVDPFNHVNSGEYIRGTMTNNWVQQKRVYNFVNGTRSEYDVRIVESIVTTPSGLDPRVDLAIGGFGPNNGVDTWPLPTDGTGGTIHDNEEARGDWFFPEDGSDLTFLGSSSPNTRFFTGTDPLAPTSGNRDSILTATNPKQGLYFLHTTNGYIDSIAPVAAMVEIGSNVNIVNDLVDSTVQVAGYSIQVGGDFGTVNGKTTDVLKPAEGDEGGRTVVWGVNDLAYIWSSTTGLFDVESANGNVAVIGGDNLVNNVTGDATSPDTTVMLGLDSGYSLEETETDIIVLSDVVIWDFYMQRVDLLSDPADAANYYDGGAPTTVEESVTIAPGDDLIIHLSAYVRPPLYTDLSEDEGGVTNYARNLTAEFYLVPFQTNVPVKITANITREENDLSGLGLDPDSDDDHVRGIVEGRVLTIWTVVLENPLQDLGSTDVATGYIKAVITSTDDDGNVLNVVSTRRGDSNAITRNTLGIDADTENTLPVSAPEANNIEPDLTLDSRVKSPLNTDAGEAVITVDPTATPFPAPAP